MRLFTGDERISEHIADALGHGKVVIMPCDTMYGFVGKAPETDGVIRGIKGRGETKPFLIVLLEDMIGEITAEPIPSEIRALWPGPLTVIVNHRRGGTQAIRIPDNQLLEDVLRRTAAPLFSTSVNRSGRDPLNQIDEIAAEFESEVYALIDGGDFKKPIPSTILDITTFPYTILRQGALEIPEQLLK